MPKIRLPNGFGSITKLSGNRRKPYIVRKTKDILEDGRQVMYIVGYYSKYSEAMEALVEFNNKGNMFIDTKQFTFRAVYEAFIAYKYTGEGKAIPSIYTTSYRRCQRLHDMQFSSIKLINLEEIIKDAPTPVNKRDVKTLFNQLYKYAIKHEITDKNVASSLDTVRLPKSTLHKAFTEDEIMLLWQHKNELGAKLWLIYCYTGLRPQELLLITKDKVFLNDRYMIGGIKTENGIDRDIPLAECIVPIIEYFYEGSNQYLIEINGKPLPYDKLALMLGVFCEQNKLNHLPHDGRHTMATRLDNIDGISFTLIQRILGHSTDKSTTSKVYIHKALPEMLKAVNKLPAY